MSQKLTTRCTVLPKGYEMLRICKLFVRKATLQHCFINE